MSYRFETLSVHAGQPCDPSTGAINTPIFQSSTFGQAEPGLNRGFDYARTNHPTRLALEENLAAIEGGRFAAAFASGLAAIHAVLATLRAGDHVVASRDLYGGSWRQFTKYWAKFGLEFTFVDGITPGEVAHHRRRSTKLLWLETPSNPLLRVADIAACAAVARAAGIITVVDNTFATPVLQRPLELGADIVIHSTTKYINGHSDTLGGAVITNDPRTFEQVKFFQNAIGASPGALDCYLILRGTKTLSLRVERHCDSAESLARFLVSHPDVSTVQYPHLPNHPQFALAKKQMARGGGIVSFVLPSGEGAARSFLRNLRLWTIAESLGGPKSLVAHPATMTHASVEPEVRRAVGIEDGLIRLSVGLEHVDDLIEDIDQSLALACSGARERRSA